MYRVSAVEASDACYIYAASRVHAASSRSERLLFSLAIRVLNLDLFRQIEILGVHLAIDLWQRELECGWHTVVRLIEVFGEALLQLHRHTNTQTRESVFYAVAAAYIYAPLELCYASSCNKRAACYNLLGIWCLACRACSLLSGGGRRRVMLLSYEPVDVVCKNTN